MQELVDEFAKLPVLGIILQPAANLSQTVVGAESEHFE